MKIMHVPTEWVPQTWPQVQAHIAAALDFCDDYTLEEARTLLLVI